MQLSHSDDKKDGYKIGILSLYPWHPEKEHSQTTFFQSNKAPEQREDLIRGEKLKNEIHTKTSIKFRYFFDIGKNIPIYTISPTP